MPFVKLDCKILDSTLWLDIEGSRMFITALLMAEPWDTEVAIPQLDVNTMDPTGWEVPPGWYGFVPAAGPGIVRRAGLDMKAGMDALVRLGTPELESRSPNYGGRRLVRIDGGFLVLNYMHYRDKDHGAAERMRNYRVLVKTGLAPIIRAQGGRCDCCGELFEKPYVKYVVQDHDHKTHKNRGLVCQSCNTVVGRIERGLSTYGEKREPCLKYIERYTVTANVTPVHTNVTQADADADADAEVGGNVVPPVPPLLAHTLKKLSVCVSSAQRSTPDDARPAREKNKGSGEQKPAPCPHQDIIDLYHELLPMCPRIREWRAGRARMLAMRWREDPDRQDLKWWEGFFTYVAESKFLTGRGKLNGRMQPFVVSLEWLIRPSNFTKVYEGQYE